MDTINRLLKKQAPKRLRRMDMTLAEGSDDDEHPSLPRPPAAYVRFVQNSEGSRLGVPEEWLDGPAAQMLKDGHVSAPAGVTDGWSGKMVEEVA